MRIFSLAFLIALVAAAALVAGRYSVVTAQQNDSAILFVTDRFTGNVTICGVAGCRPLRTIVETRPAPASP
jgi:hypothetical protein